MVATDLQPSSLKTLESIYSPSRLLIQTLDVTKTKDITVAFSAAITAFGKVDVVFSNAGIIDFGEVEGTPEDIARKMFEVNYWGSVNVCLEAVKTFRDRTGGEAGGRLLITTSAAGIACIPCFGHYAASKHALEAFGETLASEMDRKWNIKVTMIEPGAFATNLYNSFSNIPAHPAYSEPTLPTSITRAANHNRHKLVGSPEKAASQIIRVAALAEPPLRLPLGKDAISKIEAHLKKVAVDVEAYVSWSEDLVESV